MSLSSLTCWIQRMLLCLMLIGNSFGTVQSANANIVTENFVPESDLICIASSVNPASAPDGVRTYLPPLRYKTQECRPKFFDAIVSSVIKGSSDTPQTVKILAFVLPHPEREQGAVYSDFDSFLSHTPYLLFLKYDKSSGTYRLLRPVDSSQTAYEVRIPKAALEGNTPAEQVFSLMFSLLGDSDPKIRRTALVFTGHLGEFLRDTPPDDLHLSAAEREWLTKLAKYRAVPVIKAYLASHTDSDFMRTKFLAAGARLQIVETIPALTELGLKTGDKSGYVSYLTVFQVKAAVPYLAPLLTNQNASVREYALESVRHFTDYRYIPFLLDLLADSHAGAEERSITYNEVFSLVEGNSYESIDSDEFAANTAKYVEIGQKWKMANQNAVTAWRKAVQSIKQKSL